MNKFRLIAISLMVLIVSFMFEGAVQNSPGWYAVLLVIRLICVLIFFGTFYVVVTRATPKKQKNIFFVN
jgi:ABC-type thiamin/hydroxymethylpyrimidine transport system permease subunit